MLEDLKTTEGFLKTFIPSVHDDGGDFGALKKLSGSLSVIFFQHAASENLPALAPTIRLLQEIVPPDGIKGRLQDIHDNPEEFHLYNFFGRADEFWRNRDKRKDLDEDIRKQSIADDLYRFKQKPLENGSLAQRILASYIISNTEALSEEKRNAREKAKIIFSHILRKIPPTAEYTEQHFSKQHISFNFGEKSIIIDKCKKNMPDDTFSTFLASRKYIPQTHLVAADMNTRTFKRDGVFFEGANFRAASMMRTQWDLNTTSIRGALLEGADLRGAKGLTAEALAEAYIDERTRLPAEIKYKTVISLHKQNDMPPPPLFTKNELRYMPKRA